jgi:hypothetical protein
MTLRRFYYLCALACLVGMCVCAFRFTQQPTTIGEVLEEVQNHDRSAQADVDAAVEENQDPQDLLLKAAGCFVGLCVFMTLAKRSG